MTTEPQSALLQKILLDVRGLLPPAPMQRALEALALLPPRAMLVVHTRREPCVLHEIIDVDGWHRIGRPLAPDHWETCIWRSEDEV
ncbi:MAG TPA: DUF2249 domain-containing protein [Opitutaceae bacterium]|nr:DUF2249 domain-containing protein [Opitutaceae bacterium]